MKKNDYKHKVAVLLAVYNGKAWIEEQIVSIRSQVQIDVKIFVSIDPSNDGSEELLESIALQYDLQILPPCGRFGGAAQNFFRLIRDVEFAQFDFVALADQDDLWFPQKLIRGCDELLKSGASGYSSNVLAFWDSGRQKLVNKAQKQTSYDHFFESAGPGCTYVMRQKDLSSFKVFLISNYEKVSRLGLHDWFLYAWFRSAGYKWIIDNKPTMFYRQHSNNQVGANEGMGAIITRLRMIRSGWYRNQVAEIAELCKIVGNVPSFMQDYRRRKLLLRALMLRRRFRDKLFIFIIALIKL